MIPYISPELGETKYIMNPLQFQGQGQSICNRSDLVQYFSRSYRAQTCSSCRYIPFLSLVILSRTLYLQQRTPEACDVGMHKSSVYFVPFSFFPELSRSSRLFLESYPDQKVSCLTFLPSRLEISIFGHTKSFEWGHTIVDQQLLL